MFRIIDNKKIEMTDDEWAMYNEICKGYDKPNFKGEHLFKDLFETNDDGLIVALRPPTKNYSSLEVYLFLMSLMEQQHLRAMYVHVDKIEEKFQNMCKIAQELISELTTLKEELQKGKK